MFMGEVVTEALNNDCMYLGQNKKLTRLSIPLIGDNEIERVVDYEKEQREKK